MPNYRRNWVEGGCFFFTVNLLDRRSDLLVAEIGALRSAVRAALCAILFMSMPGWCCRTICTACGRCRPVIWIFRFDGGRSRLGSHGPWGGRVSDAHRWSASARAVFGNGDIGSIRSAVSGILRLIWIISISIRSGMGWWHIPPIGRFRAL